MGVLDTVQVILRRLLGSLKHLVQLQGGFCNAARLLQGDPPIQKLLVQFLVLLPELVDLLLHLQHQLQKFCAPELSEFLLFHA